jgi:hypothetical protein
VEGIKESSIVKTRVIRNFETILYCAEDMGGPVYIDKDIPAETREEIIECLLMNPLIGASNNGIRIVLERNFDVVATVTNTHIIITKKA